MKHTILHSTFKSFLVALFFISSISINAQTNVFDDIIATSPDHTSLKAALEQEGLDAVLKDANASYTVFAPDNTGAR